MSNYDEENSNEFEQKKDITFEKTSEIIDEGNKPLNLGNTNENFNSSVDLSKKNTENNPYNQNNYQNSNNNNYYTSNQNAGFNSNNYNNNPYNTGYNSNQNANQSINTNNYNQNNGMYRSNYNNAYQNRAISKAPLALGIIAGILAILSIIISIISVAIRIVATIPNITTDPQALLDNAYAKEMILSVVLVWVFAAIIGIVTIVFAIISTRYIKASTIGFLVCTIFFLILIFPGYGGTLLSFISCLIATIISFGNMKKASGY